MDVLRRLSARKKHPDRDTSSENGDAGSRSSSRRGSDSKPMTPENGQDSLENATNPSPTFPASSQEQQQQQGEGNGQRKKDPLKRGNSDKTLEQQQHLRSLQSYDLDSFVPISTSLDQGRSSQGSLSGHNYSVSYPTPSSPNLQSFSVPFPPKAADDLRSRSGSTHPTPQAGGSPQSSANSSPNTSPSMERKVPQASPPVSHSRSSSASPNTQHSKSNSTFGPRRFSISRGEKKGVPSPLSLPASSSSGSPQATLDDPKSPKSPRNFGTWTRSPFSPRRKSQVEESASPQMPSSPRNPQSPGPNEDEDPAGTMPPASPRRMSLKGFSGFRKSRRGSKSQEGDTEEDPAQDQGPEGTSLSREDSKTKKGHQKARSPKGQPSSSKDDRSIDKAFGIYNTVLNTQKKNSQLAEGVAIPPGYTGAGQVGREAPPIARSRSRSGDHSYAKEPYRPAELLVRRPTGKLRQTLLRPFTAFGNTRFSSSKRDQQKQQKQQEQQQQSSPPAARANDSPRLSGHQKTQSQPANVIKGTKGPLSPRGQPRQPQQTPPAQPQQPQQQPRPTSLALSIDSTVIETRPLTGSSEKLDSPKVPQFELHSLRLSTERSRSSSQKTRETQTSDDLSTASSNSSLDPNLEFLPEDEQKKKDRKHKVHQQFSASAGQLFDLKKVLNFVEPGELPNLTQASSLPEMIDAPDDDKVGKLYSPDPKKNKAKAKRPIRSAPEIKTYFDFIRAGPLFMLLPMLSEHWNLFYCKLNMLRLQYFEGEDSPEPLYSLLLTEINEVRKEQRTDSQECVVSIFSHSVLVIKFMASAAQAKEWIADIEAARMESLRNVCSTALGRVGHTRQTSFDQYYNLYGDKGVGGYSFVKEAIDKNTGRHVIVKFINKAMVKVGPDGLPDEIDVLLKVKHANIVEVKEVFESEDYFIFIMEKFGKGTDLFDFLQDHEKLSEPEARCIFRQVLSAVVHLASQNVVHGDIKDENIIIDQDTQQIKLIDFGSNKKFTDTEEFVDYHGTKHMACPEVINHQPFKPLRQEIWSLGVLLYILLTGEVPFDTEEEILNGALPEELRFQLSDECRDLLCMMLETNPRYQASLADIVNHDWLKHEDVSPFAHRRMSGLTKMLDSSSSLSNPPQERQSPETQPESISGAANEKSN